jgi:dihydropyrimidinase
MTGIVGEVQGSGHAFVVGPLEDDGAGASGWAARRLGQPVYAEALHNYLHFTCDDYRKPGGTAIHTYPAIKFADDRDALIAGLLDGRLATTATDEYTVHKAYKLAGSTIETVCGGHNGIETRMPVAFTKFVAERKMPLTRFVDITSANAARILGLYPRRRARSSRAATRTSC